MDTTLRLYRACPSPHVPVWVSADPRMVRNSVRYRGPNRSSRSDGQPPDRGHLEATTVRAFLKLSFGCPKAEITEEHTFIARSADAVLQFNQRSRQSGVTRV